MRPELNPSLSLVNPSSRRKCPRIFFLSQWESQLPLQQVELIWPDRSRSQVLDLSLSGVVIASHGLLDRIRERQVYACRIRFFGQHDVPLQLRVQKISATNIELIMDSISSEGRLKLEAPIKDAFIFQNLRPMTGKSLKGFEVSLWFHGPLDTNFVLSSSSQTELPRAIIEYDGLCWSIFNSHTSAQRSQTASDESFSYQDVWLDKNSQKVSMGTDWKERLLRLISEYHPVELEPFSSLLQS